MHIPDGFLSNEVAMACAVPAVAAVGYGLRRAEGDLDDRRVPLLGPWLAGLVLAVVLGVQAFVFADGGITALGANVLNMGVLGGVVVGGLMLGARRVLPVTRTALLGVAAGGA